MGRLIRVLLLAFCILVLSATPLLAKRGGNGHGWGGGHGGGRGHGGGVPEIDPSLAPTAIALLSGGVLILKSKYNRK
jgi:hypothetical protein